MSILDAIILGIVQGVTEFIPVSSSGHLVIFSKFMGIGNNFVFDTLLNFGTLLALIVFYRVRIWLIIKRLFEKDGWVLAAKIVAATIPAVIIGLLFKNTIHYMNGLIWVVVLMLVVVGILMIIAGKDNKEADDREIEKSVGWGSALKIGVAQVIALIPGTSRSGITILAGIRQNLSMARAAEFSFMMAIPVLAGGTFMTLIKDDGLEFVCENLAAVVMGNVMSFVVGYLVIDFMIKLISKRGLKDFGWYRIGLASVLICLICVGFIK